MDAAHTPTPWVFNEFFCEIRAGEEGPAICDMLSTGVIDWKANARLIAAAPALLVACQAARSYIAAGAKGPPPIALLDAAITAATP